MSVTCPHCRGEIENTPAISGQVVACPHCRKQLEMPHTVASASFAPRHSSPPPRRQSSGGNEIQTYLLAGILLCGLMCVGMFAAWEIRYQSFRERMTESTERIKQQMSEMKRGMNR